MFGIDGWELLIVALVAVVVLGPERLPKAARFAGLWVRRARAQWYSVKSELERELAAEELQRSLRETRDAAHAINAEMRAAGDEARREFDAIRGQLHDADALAGGISPPDASLDPLLGAPPVVTSTDTPPEPADDTPAVATAPARTGDDDVRG
jgi:sec-independent protein translocase protein TatB